MKHNCATLCVAALLLAALFVQTATAVTGTLGVAVSVTASTATTIDFLTGERLVITSDTSGSVTVSVATSTSLALPTGYAVLSAAVGYSIVASPSTMQISSATFTTASGSVTTALIAAAGGSIPGVLYYDATANAYLDVSVPPTITNNQVAFTVPYFGQYLVLALQASVPRPAIYAKVVVSQNDNTARNYSFAGSTFSLSLSTSGSGSSVLVVTQSSTTAAQAPSGKVALGSFYNITLTGANSLSAVLSRGYTDAEVTARNINAATLRFAVNTNGVFVYRPSGFSVNTQAHVFSQSTTSFSEWGTYGDSNAGGHAATLGAGAFAVLVSGALAVMFGVF